MELTFNGQIEPGYIKEVKDILENREFMQLGAFSHHQSTSRLMHSINVSYISWHIARKLGGRCKNGRQGRTASRFLPL